MLRVLVSEQQRKNRMLGAVINLGSSEINGDNVPEQEGALFAAFIHAYKGSNKMYSIAYNRLEQ